MAKDEKEQSDFNCITPAGTACFVHVWEPHKFDDTKEPNYGLIIVFDEGEDLKELKRISGNAIRKKWGDKAKEVMKKKSWSGPGWRDAADYDKHGAPFEEGRVMVIVKSKSAPGVVNARAKPIMNQQDFYPGCRARASIYAHAFDTNGNQGVTFLLNNVQKMGEGERLAGGRKSAEDEFGPVSEGGDDSEDDDLFGT
jgi:hypothetical protein